MKYFGFRYNHQFYGGIATAYCSECNLNCVFCYSANKRDTGKERSARYVADKLIKIAHDREVNNCRISGGEATLDIDHLVEVIRIVMEESDLTFWLETNGVLMGKDPEKYIKPLLQFPPERLMITVSLKHTVPEFFGRLTGAPEDWVYFPVKAVEHLAEAGATVRIAFMEDWYSLREIDDIWVWLGETVLVHYFDGSDEVDDDELLNVINALVDVEKFRKYKSVPYKKVEIGDILNPP